MTLVSLPDAGEYPVNSTTAFFILDAAGIVISRNKQKPILGAVVLVEEELAVLLVLEDVVLLLLVVLRVLVVLVVLIVVDVVVDIMDSYPLYSRSRPLCWSSKNSYL